MKSWDLLLVIAIALATVAGAAVHWAVGAAVLAVALLNVWYFLGDTDAED